MTIHLGDVPANSTLYIPFATYGKTNGESITLTGLAVTDIEVYKNGSVTQRSSDAGFALLDTDGIDFDGITGIHGFSIDLSDNTDAAFYAVGSFYWVVVSSVTIDSQTVNFIAATFRIVAAEAIAGKPKVDVDGWNGTAVATPDTAGYPKVTVKSGSGTGELDVTSGVVKSNLAQILGTALTETSGQIAAAFKQFFNVASPTGTMKQITLVDTVTTLTNAPSDSSGVTTLLTRLSATRAGYLDNLSAGAVALEATAQSVLSKLLKYVQLIVRKDAAIATDNATELTAINANGGSGGGSFDNTTDSEQAIRDNMTTPPTAAAIADAVWEEAIADHSGTTGSTAEALNSAGSAGDPWTTALPGAYGAGSAGKIIGDNINATISSRASQASVDTIDDYVDTEVAAIKAKTDLIPASPAATSDIPSAATIADAVWDEALSGHTTAGSGGKALADIDGHTDTEIAAIKAKTDSLTFTTAGQVDAQVISVANNALTAAAAASDLGTEIATAVWASATRTLSALGFTLSASDLAADTIGASELASDAIAEIVNAVLTTAMTESYNVDGAAPTLAQALFVTMQRLTEFAISGTAVVVKKLDGSTTAYTLTLDDATSPTSTTRAS